MLCNAMHIWTNANIYIQFNASTIRTKRHVLVCVNKMITEKLRRSRLLELPHMFHKLLLVNQSLKLAVVQNAHVSKTKFDEALIDQV